ncbi:hypothetical protein [Fimbriiglobus ruber]|uniref:Phage-related tail fiber protein n=1 Tax=Fimbriiglobus ruber TaxID=1908690 RepID=A0A225DXU8_9BACT|nr:hypothetical protein [Fimbriiglobus ruber]OWK42069.1 phage-related tail fiber protein [Fimbriiglobus ruber]
MPINGYFDTPFAVGGDLNTIPDATQPSGTVSYEQGFPVGYSTPVSSGGFNVPRTAINQALNDITTAIQAYQQFGTPPFITTTMNGGTPFSYGQYARVVNAGVVYQSLVGSNTDTPPSAKWVVVNPVTQIQTTQTITGTSHTFATGDSGYLTLRSNSGTLMTDTLPGTSPGVLSQGWSAIAENNDASALYAFSVGSGADLNGSSTGTIILGPGQRCSIFSDGSNYWTKDLPSRTRLGANTTFYVSTTGSDANTGLASGTPWATIQHAINFVANNLDLGGFGATISVADGTYTGGVSVSLPFVGSTNVTLQGNTTTPTNCILSTSGDCIAVIKGAILNVTGFKTTSSGGNCISASGGGIVTVGAEMNFGSAASGSAHLNAFDGGRIFCSDGAYTVSGGASWHWIAIRTSQVFINSSLTVTLSGTPAFAAAFAQSSDNSSIYCASLTFSGSATGVRYVANANGTIDTNGGGATYLPGNSAGTTANGGQYI